MLAHEAAEIYMAYYSLYGFNADYLDSSLPGDSTIALVRNS